MCNIIVLEPGVLPKKDDLSNMCYNNWHSFGLVTQIENSLDVKRVLPKSGEIDPEEVWDLLNKDVKYRRYLHVRHNTAGATTLENCHPFDVMYSESRQILFMHNGTMHEYKSKKFGNTANYLVDDPDGPSDTKNFVEQVLVGMATTIRNADFHDAFVQKILSKFFPTTGNRGLLIISDQEPVYLGDWKMYESSTPGVKYKTSNDDYFKAVIRGPEFSRREAKKSVVPFRNDNWNYQSSTKTNKTLYKLPDKWEWDYKEPNLRVLQLENPLVDILDDTRIWSTEGILALSAATEKELESICKNPSTAVSILAWVLVEFSNLNDEFLEVTDKWKSATKLIASLKEEQKNG